ncbi:MAG: hypothetical protein LBN41_10070 [Enterobacteriaceae bacterium]|jgi:hypothetical protein|nr:hypothetical protein [Enterobacteriaceae bacterium]
MSWSIPEIPKKIPSSRPALKLWGSVLGIMLVSGTVLALFPGKVTSYGEAFLYGTLPAFLLWLCFFSLAFHRYQQSVNIALLWDKETERTKKYWQHWSMKQLVVVGNVVLTPEEQGIHTLLGEYADIPAYPQKARSLFFDSSDFWQRLKYIDEQCEKQCPGYRNYLHTIKLLYADKRQQERVTQVIYAIWDLYPEYVSSVEKLYAGYDENDSGNLALLLSVQDWSEGRSESYSEFITGQLITSASFARMKTLPILAGVGRILPSEALTKDLDILFEYNCLDYENLRYVWLSGMETDTRTALVQYAALKHWALPSKMPYLSLDHSFAFPGPLMFPVAISLVTDAAIETGKMQLLISQHSQNDFLFCLITRDLLL